jgi:hypothetical protein
VAVVDLAAVVGAAVVAVAEVAGLAAVAAVGPLRLPAAAVAVQVAPLHRSDQATAHPSGTRGGATAYQVEAAARIQAAAESPQPLSPQSSQTTGERAR